MFKKIPRNWIVIFSVAAVFILLASARECISFVVDWQFFREIGYEAVFTKTLIAKLLTGLAFGVTAFLTIFVNLIIAGKRTFSHNGLNSLWGNLPQFSHIDFGRVMGSISFLAALAAFVLAFPIGTRYWEQALLFLNSVPAGLTDPLFGKDISFFLFQYPFIDAMNTTVRGMIVIAALLTTVIYVLRGGVALMGRSFSVDAFVKRHLGVLVSLFLLSLAASFFLDRYSLLNTEHGVLYGASYTDVHARLVMLWVMIVLTVVTALAVSALATHRSVAVPLIAILVLVCVYVLGLKVYPSIFQSVKVSPNESVLEQPYLTHHIQFTRFGYGLENIELQPFATGKPLTFSDIRRNISTIQNIRLWDEEPLLKTYSQLQQIRTYYHFNDVDNDRYTVNGKYLQVMLSPRELSYADLPGKSWINERLVFTHGFGIAMGPVSGITKEGLPEFFIKDIPPISSAGPKVTRPEIYYGESPNDYVIVNTKTKEFNYPTTKENIYTIYTGSGGVKLSSGLTRLLYSAYFGNLKITGKIRSSA